MPRRRARAVARAGRIADLKQQGAGDIAVTVGGIIPSKDYKMLEAAGVKAIFGPGTQIPAAARRVLGLIANVGR